jgi:hypothetical protein
LTEVRGKLAERQEAAGHTGVSGAEIFTGNLFPVIRDFTLLQS